MVKRQLLYKEWKQSELTFILVMLVAVFTTPLSFLLGYSSFQTCVNDPTCTTVDHYFYYNFSSDIFIALSWTMGLFFAIIQLGYERNKGQIDFTLSLPFSRSTIFHTKFFLGAGIITLVHVLSYAFTYLLILGIQPKETFDFNSSYLIALVSTLMIYSLCLAAGALTGSAISQAIVTFSTSILPYLLIWLPMFHLDFIFKTDRSWVDASFDHFIMPISPITYITDFKYRDASDYPTWFTGEEFIIPIVMMIVFYLIGLFSFMKHPIERNGRFFLYSKMDRPIQILVIVFGVLGFGWVGFSSDTSILGYIVGMIIGGVVGALTSYFLIYRKR
ncbi:ABC transporter permease subunit [Bacillus pumilus]|uniref:ABC transporter ATP-binding protein n=2 Tax=Bacillus pumilus TaxID=1408 RepID=A8FGG6_BACP2|nr:ABC transporter permease subunit [Bacillus pumilus]ABV63333.1 ABC transporter ATP-binding protein [Bacillus pumilus SAFR-032]MBC3643106.1 ABC transporter permease subunit [Bacillus pumilus]MBC3645555.1 ABC transporter permease subunit [Bacillus pumilus]MBC3649078.1 ABC transporter permease subunit [Bacillus pumilus]MBC3653553.1 ABC transporter permease subunit [Bacillus pumilus]